MDDWTYWEPLVGWGSRAPVGLRSSWDDETSTRKGVAWDSIKEFLQMVC